MAAGRSYSFGEYTLDLGRGALRVRGVDLKLRPKSFAVLSVLVERHGELVTKDELLAAVWGHTVVTEGSVNQCIIDLRRVLGDDAHCMIRTIPRRGYLFDAAVQECTATRADASAAVEPRLPAAISSARAVTTARFMRAGVAVFVGCVVSVATAIGVWSNGPDLVPSASPATAPHNSIAVLPFVNMSADPEEEYFSDGIAEEILNSLAQLPELRVIARTSSFSFKGENASIEEIAERLNVAYVLEGSVRKSRDRVRITAQLVDGRDSAHLWSATYDREVPEAFLVQSDIARRVTEALKVTLAESVAAGAQPTRSAEARDAYLRARFFYNRRSAGDLDRAKSYYEQALRLEPEYAEAWAGVAAVYGVQMCEGAVPAGAGRHQQRIAIEHALANGDTSAEVHLRAAEYFFMIGGEERAARHIARAYALDPDHPLVLDWYANVLADHYSYAAWIALQRRVVQLDPLSAAVRVNFATYLFSAGHPEEAAQEFARAVELNPDFKTDVDVDLARILVFERRYGEAFDRVQHWAPGAERDEALAMIDHALGREDDVEAAMRRLTQDRSLGAAVRLAEIHAQRGDVELAFQWMGVGWDRLSREPPSARLAEWQFRLRHSPFLTPLRSDPRWWQVRARAAVPELALASVPRELM